MALVVADRVQETTGTTGTSSYALLGAATGYQSFGAVLADGDTTYYAITNDTDWEVGVGTYSTTGPTLARTTILASSNGGSAVNWGVGVKNIFISYAASKASFLDANGALLVADKIVHTGDTDTAIRFPAANTMSVETGGTERLKVENSTITTTVPIVLPGDPTSALHAATKQYVDEVAEGLRAKPAAKAATTANLSATYNNGTSGVGATLTSTTNGAFPTLDGVSSWAVTSPPMGVLVKNQSNAAQNGRYNLTTLGDGSAPWVLTRCGLCDTSSEIPGSYIFVTDGTLYADTGWVMSVSDPSTFTIGTDPINVIQFSGAGTYTAGSGLALNGTEFSNTAPDQTVTLTQGGATTITGTYPNFTISSVNTTYTAGGGIGLTTTEFSVAAGSGLTQDADGLSHADTSSQASVDNSGATFVQDINLDGFGHVTGAASVTVTPSLIGAPQNDGTGATGTWGISISGNANNVSGTVSVSNGGTGATTVGQARTNLDVPTRSGGDASGTWNIAISGNAATVTNGVYTSDNVVVSRGSLGDPADWNAITTAGVYTIAAGSLTGANNPGGYPYGTLYVFTDGARVTQFYTRHSSTSQTSVRNKFNASDWQPWANLLSALDYTSYAPSLTGSGASGNWGINVTGNAATATSLSTDRTNWSTNGTIDDVVGQLAWKNYGNNHTIFDASQSTSPSGTGVNDTNAQIAWSASYPTLMGWNGANTYGVRVDSARAADNTTGSSYSVNLGGTGNTISSSAWAGGGGYHGYTYNGGNFRFGFSSTSGVIDVYADGNFYATDSSHLVLHTGNYTTYTAARNGSGYLIPDNWIQLNGFYGLYSTNNNAHFFPNNGSYGSWKVQGTRNGWAGLEFQDSNTSLMMNTETYGIHRNGVGWRFYLENANGYFPGNVTAYWSDARLKENLREIKGEALEILGSFTAYRFNWNEKVEEIGATIPVGKEEIGLIAQQVQAALPDAVCVNKAGAPIDGAEFDYLTINYDRITPLLVEGVNIHEKELASLRERVQRLEALVDRLTGGVAGDSGGA